jgi:protein-ribulosamine 3-kinase
MGSLHPIFTRICKELEPDAIFTTHGYQLVSSSGNAYYIKLGSANNYEQWRGEAESLRAMHEAAPGLAPKLFAFGVTDEDGNDVEPGTPGTRTYFISTYSDHTGLTDRSAVILGRRIASEMHCHESPNGKFGFEVPTYCGATKFSNGWYDTWAECFSAMIAQMLGYLQARGEFESLQEKGRNVQERCVVPDD